jgi:hypothetical protein
VGALPEQYIGLSSVTPRAYSAASHRIKSRRPSTWTLRVTDFRSVTGQGVTGRISGQRVAVGNATLLLNLGIPITTLESRAEALRREGATAMFVAIEERAAGIIAVADPIKATTPSAIERLRANGVRIVMLTGDNRTTAQAVAVKLGITEIEAEVLPDRKNEIVRRLRKEGRIVAMAGDGVNDAPCARGVRCWSRHGYRDRCGDAERRGDVGEGRSRRYRAGAVAQSCDDAQHPSKPCACVRLQRARYPNRCRRALSGVWTSVEPYNCGGGDEPEFRLGDRELIAIALRAAVSLRR